MNISVVGGNGFIGKEFVNYAGRSGHKTTVLGSAFDAFSETGRSDIKHALSETEALVFLAARRTTSTFSLEDYLYNIKLAGTYFDIAKETGIKNLVIASSTAVYSSENLPWKECDTDTPLSLYGASKQAIDALALYYNDKYDMQIKSLRIAQVIGMGERKGFLLNTLIDNAIAGKKQTIYGRGTGRRQYIYVKDVCGAILHCLENCAPQKGIFNIGMEGNVSIIELAETINDVFGNTAGIEILKDKPEDTKEYLMDTDKAKKILKWEAGYDIRSTFEDIIKVR